MNYSFQSYLSSQYIYTNHRCSYVSFVTVALAFWSPVRGRAPSNIGRSSEAWAKRKRQGPREPRIDIGDILVNLSIYNIYIDYIE